MLASNKCCLVENLTGTTQAERRNGASPPGASTCLTSSSGTATPTTSTHCPLQVVSCTCIADSAQTEYCTTFHCPCVCVSVCHKRDISHFSHILTHKCHVNHQGTHQTLYILNQNHPGYLSSKDQTRQDHLLCPDQPDHLF